LTCCDWVGGSREEGPDRRALGSQNTIWTCDRWPERIDSYLADGLAPDSNPCLGAT